MRLDVYLVAQHHAPSRQKAQYLIAGGCVFVNDKVVTKPAFSVSDADCITLLGSLSFVGRGGEKLHGAISTFPLSVTGLTVADIGASTGGFTDCLLRCGAERVFAVDCGHGQLAPKLQADTRVVSMEGCNARYLTPDLLGQTVDAVVCDVSFISLTLLVHAVAGILKPEGFFVALIKPQFEVGKANLGKNGIVKAPSARRMAVERVICAAREAGLFLHRLMQSPITGGDGNIEYLALFDKTDEKTDEKPDEKTDVKKAMDALF